MEIAKLIASDTCNDTNFEYYKNKFDDVKNEIFKCVFEDVYRDIIWLQRFIAEYFELLRINGTFADASIVRNRILANFEKLEQKLSERIRTNDALSSSPADAVIHGKVIEKSNMTYEQMEKYLRDIKEF